MDHELLTAWFRPLSIGTALTHDRGLAMAIVDETQAEAGVQDVRLMREHLTAELLKSLGPKQIGRTPWFFSSRVLFRRGTGVSCRGTYLGGVVAGGPL